MKENKNLFIVLGLGVIMIGGFSLWMDHQQKLFRSQTQGLQMQVKEQANVIDSMRLIGQAELMNHILAKIDDELKENPNRILSEERISGIAALCFVMKPYASFRGDSLSVKKFSPERGQMLLMLCKMNMDTGSLHKIYSQATFSNAELRGADLSGTDLRGVDLKGADLLGANLQDANLSGADLSFSNLWGANLSHAKLDSANLKRADLKWAFMNDTDLKKADLTEADMTSAQLRQADLSGAVLQWSEFGGAFLNEANLTGADMFRSNLRRAQLPRTILSGANLTLAILSETNLTETNFDSADLNGVYLMDPDWLDQLNEWHVSSAEEIQNKFKVVEAISYDKSKYQLKKN